MNETKQCPRCGEEKPLTEFTRNRTRPDGWQSWCKPCDAEYAREYREENREEMVERDREYNRCVKNPACPAVGGNGAEFVTYTCEVCGTEFRRLKSKVAYDYEHRGSLPRFCSTKCMGVSQRKGYRSPYARKIESIQKEAGA